MNWNLLIISAILAFTEFSKATEIAELNETNVFLSIKAQLFDLKSELNLQRTLLNGVLQQSSEYKLKSYPQNCAAVKSDGIFEIRLPKYSTEPFKVSCDASILEGGWLVILRRMDGSVDFHRSWNVYKKGFGDLDGEFFLGLDKIHALTAERSQELLVVLRDSQEIISHELYEKFAIADEDESFALRILGKASGTAGDSLRTHFGMKFSTHDRDNDLDSKRHCAQHYTAAWWYRACHDSNLAGLYKNNNTGAGINWRSFRGVNYSLKYVAMMIRPRK